ncbi:translation elongation factor EF-Ts Tsf1 [Schizosaccharomyces cryophilus OY26]|uniref:Elongation factor Ts, mitochondrial n=1 Tax=Schizosaccharomyces cryophilus (strain OY26 / ATCC MYA-4695 / CBS 11777 / NBRC 106824 / NRRL Y48691) TaxID=653667 RepID=S9WXV6_SCHCR|nr:translation elongation factor EF-Ts Tsf1 [Schizosaccharomyces cryophilus OY26]EPY49552.1 translation elongation factor EF-Ts Tsf1 [Schizosaccharomyces cryophilus OY26]
MLRLNFMSPRLRAIQRPFLVGMRLQGFSKMSGKMSDIKQLRIENSASIEIIKQAVEEAGVGNLEKAREILSKKIQQRGGKIAEKTKDRVAKQGWISQCVSADRKKAIMVEVNCESDFVSQTASFQEFSRTIASCLLHHVPSNESRIFLNESTCKDMFKDKTLTFPPGSAAPDSSNGNLSDYLVKAASLTGEKVNINRVLGFNALQSNSCIGIYAHGATTSSSSTQLGRIASMILIQKESSDCSEIADLLAKEIVAQAPDSTDEFLSLPSISKSSKTIQGLLEGGSILDWIRWERGAFE